MSEAKVRLATSNDVSSIAEFNCALARETEGKTLVPEVVNAGVRRLLRSPDRGFYLVAERDGETVAMLMVTTEWSDWRNGVFWWIQSVYVHPKSRRQGLYRSLYEHVKNEAEKDVNVRGFRLYVERENFTAQETYRSLGMVETSYKLFEEEKSEVVYME